MGLAFHFVYRWDHEVAVAETARQAAVRFGWGWRGSLYVNYAFLTWWLADVCWRWAARDSQATRSFRFESIRLAAFTFMFEVRSSLHRALDDWRVLPRLPRC